MNIECNRIVVDRYVVQPNRKRLMPNETDRCWRKVENNRLVRMIADKDRMQPNRTRDIYCATEQPLIVLYTDEPIYHYLLLTSIRNKIL